MGGCRWMYALVVLGFDLEHRKMRNKESRPDKPLLRNLGSIWAEKKHRRRKSGMSRVR